MSNSRIVLQRLREVTMPLHKELEAYTIASKLYNKTLNKDDYKNHLISTHGINEAFAQNLFGGQQNTAWFSMLGLQSDLGNSILMEDLAAMNLHSRPISGVTISYEPTKQHAIALLYTWIGSSRGSKMISSYVGKNLNGVSTKYFDFISNTVVWNTFTEWLDQLPTIEPTEADEIASQGKSIFQAIKNSYIS